MPNVKWFDLGFPKTSRWPFSNGEFGCFHAMYYDFVLVSSLTSSPCITIHKSPPAISISIFCPENRVCRSILSSRCNHDWTIATSFRLGLRCVTIYGLGEASSEEVSRSSDYDQGAEFYSPPSCILPHPCFGSVAASSWTIIPWLSNLSRPSRSTGRLLPSLRVIGFVCHPDRYIESMGDGLMYMTSVPRLD
jgi:hypothetical protein